MLDDVFEPSPADYARIQRAIQYLIDNAEVQPSLSHTANAAGLSEFHFQRLFQTYVGVTPKTFLQALTLEKAKERLARSESLLSTSHGVGLSGAGRLHDLFVSMEGMTPGEFKAGGICIHYAILPTLFGQALFSATDRGLCGLTFVMEGEDPLSDLQQRWDGATFSESPAFLEPYARELDARLAGKAPKPLSFLLKGTPFQVKIWQALLQIPEGSMLSYQGLAQLSRHPRASRAVGTAMAANPIGVFIPCHRVIRGTGVIGQYRWGSGRKRALLALESRSAG